MYEDRVDPVAGMNFVMRLNACIDIPLKKVGSISEDFEYETIRQGGINDYVSIRQKQISQVRSFDVEFYVSKGYSHNLALGTSFKIPILIIVSDAPGFFDVQYVRRMYAFSGCTVIGRTYGDLDAESGSLIVESAKIAYERMVPLTFLD